MEVACAEGGADTWTVEELRGDQRVKVAWRSTSLSEMVGGSSGCGGLGGSDG